MALDIANDYQIFDRVANEETVTHVSRGLTTNTVDTVSYALGRFVNRQEVQASGGYFTTQDRVWHFGNAEMAAAPKEGDQVIQSDGVIWQVLTAHHETLKTRWRLVCRRERAGSTLLHQLQAHWRLNETTFSDDAVDAWGANTLTAVNGPGVLAGKLGGARRFNFSEYFTIADNAALSVAGHVGFSIGMWVWFDSMLSVQPVVKKWGVAGVGEYALQVNGGTVNWFVSSNGFAFSEVSAGALATGTWHFIIVDHDPDADEIGIRVNDGTRVTTAHAGGVHDGANPFRLGADGTGAELFLGRLDSVSFGKRVWSRAEHRRLYNGTLGLDLPFSAA